jgi:hypothetical protein
MKVWYPNTSEAIRKTILAKFPDAKPNEYRAEWRDDFDTFRSNPWQVACRILWMLDYLKNEEFLYGNNPTFAGQWIGIICGQLEGLGWINPGVFSQTLHVDHSSGHDE